MIRLAGKLGSHPAFAKTLGVEAPGAEKNQNKEFDPKSLTDV